jgi:hypothetical protein
MLTALEAQRPKPTLLELLLQASIDKIDLREAASVEAQLADSVQENYRPLEFRDGSLLEEAPWCHAPKLEEFETLEAYSVALVDWTLELRMFDSAAGAKRGKPRLYDFPTFEDYLVAVVDWILSARPFLDCLGIRQPKFYDFPMLEDYCVELVHWKLDRRWFDLQEGTRGSDED